MAKQTIYVDQDDEITAVIGKIQQSTNKVIAVVLPANSGVFTSTINLKLIKKVEDTYKKSIVLITNNTHIAVAAGAAGTVVPRGLHARDEHRNLHRDRRHPDRGGDHQRTPVADRPLHRGRPAAPGRRNRGCATQ